MRAVKSAIIGSGFSVNVQIPAWRLMGGPEVFGLWVRSEEKVPIFKQKLDLPLVTTDWKALISHPEVDLVSIVAPPYIHKEMTLFALQAKKHVICEKPFAMNISEAKEMLEAAKQHPNQITWIDHELRFLEIFQRMKASLSKLGKILSIHCSGILRKDPNHDFGWWDDKTLGGGLLGAIGSHYIDLLSWLTGLRITSVSAQLNNQVKTTRDGKVITSDDWFLLNVRWGEDGVPGLIHSHCQNQKSTHSITIRSEAGIVKFEHDTNKGIDTNFVVTSNTGETLESFIEVPPPEPLLNNLFPKGIGLLGLAVVETITSGVPSPFAATFEDGVYVQAVLDAARESHHGRSIFVDVKI